MESKSNSQLLVSLMLLGVFCSQTLALPLDTYSTMRLGNGMLFDGPNEPDQNPGLLKVENDYLESSLPKNDLSFGGGPRSLTRNRRHGEGTFTSDISKFLESEAAKEFIKFLINLPCKGKCNRNHAPQKRQAPSDLPQDYNEEMIKKLFGKYLKTKCSSGKRILERKP